MILNKAIITSQSNLQGLATESIDELNESLPSSLKTINQENGNQEEIDKIDKIENESRKENQFSFSSFKRLSNTIRQSSSTGINDSPYESKLKTNLSVTDAVAISTPKSHTPLRVKTPSQTLYKTPSRGKKQENCQNENENEQKQEQEKGQEKLNQSANLNSKNLPKISMESKDSNDLKSKNLKHLVKKNISLMSNKNLDQKSSFIPPPMNNQNSLSNPPLIKTRSTILSQIDISSSSLSSSLKENKKLLNNPSSKISNSTGSNIGNKGKFDLKSSLEKPITWQLHKGNNLLSICNHLICILFSFKIILLMFYFHFRAITKNIKNKENF